MTLRWMLSAGSSRMKAAGRRGQRAGDGHLLWLTAREVTATAAGKFLQDWGWVEDVFGHRGTTRGSGQRRLDTFGIVRKGKISRALQVMLPERTRCGPMMLRIRLDLPTLFRPNAGDAAGRGTHGDAARAEAGAEIERGHEWYQRSRQYRQFTRGDRSKINWPSF